MGVRHDPQIDPNFRRKLPSHADSHPRPVANTSRLLCAHYVCVVVPERQRVACARPLARRVWRRICASRHTTCACSSADMCMPIMHAHHPPRCAQVCPHACVCVPIAPTSRWYVHAHNARPSTPIRNAHDECVGVHASACACPLVHGLGVHVHGQRTEWDFGRFIPFGDKKFFRYSL